MASTKSSRVNPKYRKRYRVGNWQAYERGMRARGDVTVWFAEEALSTWTPPPPRRRGGQRRYSNLAILTALPSSSCGQFLVSAEALRATGQYRPWITSPQ